MAPTPLTLNALFEHLETIVNLEQGPPKVDPGLGRLKARALRRVWIIEGERAVNALLGKKDQAVALLEADEDLASMMPELKRVYAHLDVYNAYLMRQIASLEASPVFP